MSSLLTGCLVLFLILRRWTPRMCHITYGIVDQAIIQAVKGKPAVVLFTCCDTTQFLVWVGHNTRLQILLVLNIRLWPRCLELLHRILPLTPRVHLLNAHLHDTLGVKVHQPILSLVHRVAYLQISLPLLRPLDPLTVSQVYRDSAVDHYRSSRSMTISLDAAYLILLFDSLLPWLLLDLLVPALVL